jgi:hypothetical protein
MVGLGGPSALSDWFKDYGCTYISGLRIEQLPST